MHLMNARDDVVVLVARLVVEQRLALHRLLDDARRRRCDRRRRRRERRGRPRAPTSARRASPRAARAISVAHLGRRRAASALAQAALAVGERAVDERARSSASDERLAARTTWQRDSSAAMTSNDGFSVVAPISVTVPASTWGSSASCCALLKRWISSMNSSVRAPCWSRRSPASAIASRSSFDARPAPPTARRSAALALARRAAAPAWSCRSRAAPTGSTTAARAPRAPGRSSLPGPEQVLLPDELVERARAHALGQRLPAPILSQPRAQTGPRAAV